MLIVGQSARWVLDEGKAFSAGRRLIRICMAASLVVALHLSAPNVAAAAWTVSLSPGSMSVGGNQSVTLTASTNQDVGPTAYGLYIVDLTNGQARDCSSGSSCSWTVSYSGATHNFVARIGMFDGSQTQVTSSTTTIAWGSSAPSILGIVNLAQANLRVGNLPVGPCGPNSLGGTNFYTSCTGDYGGPEYWCADFVEWLWANNGVNISGLSAAAWSFYTYGQENHTLSSTPTVGDAVVFTGPLGHHVAVVTWVSADKSQIDTISGDWGGSGADENTWAGNAKVVDNGTYAISSASGVMGMTIDGFVAPATGGGGGGGGGGGDGGGKGGSGPCAAPVLGGPSDGATVGIDQITFSWNAATGCSFNGYTLRVRADANFDGPTSEDVTDAWVAGNSQLVTIPSSYQFQTLYWAVGVAYAPNGADWSQSSFRLDSLVVTSPLVMTPSSPVVGETVRAQFTITNESSQAITVKRIVAGGRGPNCADWSCTTGADFPSETGNPADTSITIQAGGSFSYDRQRIFTAAGSGYFVQPFIEDAAGGWHNDMQGSNMISFSVGAGLEITSQLVLNPSNPVALISVTGTYTIHNASTRSITIPQLGIVARPSCAAADWTCPNGVDFPATGAFTLAAGASATIAPSRSFTAPGSYFAEPAYADPNGWWFPVPGEQRVSFTVGNPAAAKTFKVAVATIPTAAGAADSVTVTAKDASGTTVTGYTGKIHFTSSDTKAVLPADYTFVAADKGVHTFSVTLRTAGTQTLTAADTVTKSIIGSQAGIVVSPAAATHLVVSGYPTSDVAGVAHTVTVTAKDAYNNTAVGYRGTVHITTTSASATLPANYTFTASSAGVHSFSVTLKTAGTRSITATDTKTATIKGSQTGIVVK